MTELQAILKALPELEALGEPAVLATVVNVQGSTYRRPGARMFITPAGKRIGSISGGCLEDDVARKAWQLTGNGQVRLLTYDATASDDGLWGLGLGCNGRVEILVERIEPGDDHPFNMIGVAQAQRRISGLVTIFAAEGIMRPLAGKHLAFYDHGLACYDPWHLPFYFPALEDNFRRCLEMRSSANVEYTTQSGRARVLIEIIPPAPRLLICGAGFDAVPVTEAAKALGWHVTVADRRAGYATQNHFPSADQILVAPADRIVESATPDAHTAAVIMHHNYPDDLAALRALVPSPVNYIGVLGPKVRRNQMLMDLESQGFTPTAPQLERLHGPAGLDLGAETPAEIAASIISEILAVSRQRRGGLLREQIGPIHDALESDRPTAQESQTWPAKSH